MNNKHQDLIDTVLEEERERAALIVEEMMEDEEHWKPIANRILDKPHLIPTTPKPHSLIV